MPETQIDRSGSTSTESAIQIVERFLDAMRARDLERAFALLSDDIEYQNVPFPPDRGRTAAERTLRRFMQLPGDVRIDVHHIAERDGFVLTERTDGLRGSWYKFDFWVCGTFQVRGGKIVLWRDYFDIATFLTQLVAAPVRGLLRARTPQPAS
ncbi:MAG TPA: limonene-1,2-epoxide hydrolase family protein [Polyangiales bacterium]|nr:limonene-1,2-epoxide hydrolase family protein [Polyangiales bacterium]